MQKTNNYVLAIFAAALLTSPLCAKVMESSVATVNGRPVLASEYNAYVEGVIDQYKAASPQTLAQPYAGDLIGKFKQYEPLLKSFEDSVNENNAAKV